MAGVSEGNRPSTVITPAVRDRLDDLIDQLRAVSEEEVLAQVEHHSGTTDERVTTTTGGPDD